MENFLKFIFMFILVAAITVASAAIGRSFVADNNLGDSNPPVEDGGESTPPTDDGGESTPPTDDGSEDVVTLPLNTIVTTGTGLSVSFLNSDGGQTNLEAESSIFGSDILWTPGHKEGVTLTITNNGEDTVRYSLGVNYIDKAVATDSLGNEIKLSEALQFGFANSLSEDYEILTSKALNSDYAMVGTLERGCSQTLALVVFLPDSAENIFAEAEVGLGVFLNASQSTNDDEGEDSISGIAGFNASANLEGVVENGSLSAPVTIGGEESSMSVLVPSGVKLEEGASQLTLSVNNVDDSKANITLSDTEASRSIDVHVNGVAEDNDTVMAITVKELLPTGLNMGNYRLYHVENGSTVEMTLISDGTTPVHNNYSYDPATGDVILYLISFSEVAFVSDTENAWNGNVDADLAGEGTSENPYIIASADELAGMNMLVSNNEEYASACYKLIANVNLGGYENYWVDGVIDVTQIKENVFYPIGCWAKQEGTNAAGEIYYDFGNGFSGVFDGNGHTISGICQRTWDMDGNYDYGYWDAAMGLFGYVHGGTIKNLTVKDFFSDGEFTPTGVIAAYADGNSVFENIAIVDCNPRVYNTGNGGIIGIAGDTRGTDDDHIILRNITVDNSNKISALWGSWDVACGGLVGMYRGNVDGSGNATGDTIHFENCHVSAQIDVYNDVCANYQYYAYRYSGMIIGSVRHNKTENGHSYPDMTGISANGCTVHFGDWNDYYYCEIVANTTASYTHDHQMSRLTQVASVDGTTITYLDGSTGTVPASGWAHYVVVKAKDSDDKWIHGDGANYATCYHFKDGVAWSHENAGYHNGENGEKFIDEDGDGKADLKEDKQLVYREFNNLFTGYGWGVTSKGLTDFEGVINMDITEGDHQTSVEKFEGKVNTLVNNKEYKFNEIFNFVENGVELVPDALTVTVTSLDENNPITATIVYDRENWANSTIKLSGSGRVQITIQDYYFCIPTEIEVTVEYDAEIAGTTDREYHVTINDNSPAWSIEHNGKPQGDGTIGGMDNPGNYIIYQFVLKEDGIVDINWSIAGSHYDNGYNRGIGDLAECATMTIDGNPINIGGIELPAGSIYDAQSYWWNLQNVVIKDIELDAGVHYIEFRIKDGVVSQGVNIHSMTIKSTSEVGVKDVTYQSADIVTDNGKTYYDINLKTTKFLEASDVVFKNSNGDVYPIVSINVDENNNGVVRVDITEAAKAENDFAIFDLTVLGTKYDVISKVKLISSTLVEDKEAQKVYYRLTYRIFGYDTNSIAIVDGNKESYGAIINKQDGFIVTCDIDVTDRHELEIWPHLQIGAGLYWNDTNNTLSKDNNGDVHIPEGFDEKEENINGYTYLLYKAYDMPVVFVIEGENYVKVTNIELKEKDNKVYYHLTYYVIGYEPTDLKFYNGDKDCTTNHEIDTDGYHVHYYIDITGSKVGHGYELYPHLKLQGQLWDSRENKVSSDGAVYLPINDSDLVVGEYTYKLCNIDWDSDSNNMITASLTVKTGVQYIRVVDVHLNNTTINGISRVNYYLVITVYGYELAGFTLLDGNNTQTAKGQDGFQIRLRRDIQDMEQFWPHLKYGNDVCFNEYGSNPNGDVNIYSEFSKEFKPNHINYIYRIDCNEGTWWIPRVVRT